MCVTCIIKELVEILQEDSGEFTGDEIAEECFASLGQVTATTVQRSDHTECTSMEKKLIIS